LLRLLIAVTVLTIGLSGCSSNPAPIKVAPNGEYIGWHCEGDISSDEHWRCDKKTLKDGVLVTTVTAAEMVPETAPEQAANKVSSADADENLQPRAVSEPRAVQSAPIQDAEIAESELAYSSSGYSIQLGAYDSPDKALDASRNLGLEGDIQIRQILSKGREFSVILLGQYPNRAKADAAAQALGVNYWVRSMRSLANATVQ
jgi:septal ring-binding cell division protein DamX